jgi:hypothetical protein
MKLNHVKKVPLLIALLLLIPFFWNQSAVSVSAASPKFTQSKVTIVGKDETYQMVIANKVSGCTYKWSTSNKAVAKISSKGVVTAVGKGTATIKCKIVYPTKKTKTISAKITVKIPATDIKINNAKKVNGAHILTLNETYNFNRDIFPSGSSDKTYWSIGGGDEECITIDSSSSGIVTAKKAGKVTLVATAAEKSTAESAANSSVSDAIIIEVVEPTATVRSADIIGTTQIKVVFDSPVNPSTIIDSNNKLLLSNSVVVTLAKDSKGNLAKDPGTLTPSLSSDNRTLTITASKMLSGDYGISITNAVKTMDGVALEPYSRLMSYIDTIGPAITYVDLDDSGMIATIHFTEAVDFTKLKISDATLIPTGKSTTYDPATLRTLENRLNYIPSEDLMSLTINLSNIAPTDYGKSFSIVISGVKDLAGNLPTNYTLPTVLRTDITPRPQAKPISVIRTSYNTITATFNRAIKTPGWVTVHGGSVADGKIDEKNNRKVNYTINDADASLTGAIKVEIGFWDSYNVIATDNYSQQMRPFTVNFTTDKTSPIMLEHSFNSETKVLTMKFNEPVRMIVDSGIFSTKLVTVDDDIISDTHITFKKLASDDDKIINLKIDNMTRFGKYTFTIEKGFIEDNFRNMCLAKTITISNATGSSSELPGPYAIVQSSTDLSEIHIKFHNKVDVESAQRTSNYSIPGVTILSAMVNDNTTDNGATVVLTVKEGSIDVSVERPITITGVMGYNGSYTPISAYTTTVNLKENKAPVVTSVTFDKANINTIKITFSEAIQGSLSANITQLGSSYTRLIGNTVTVDGNSIIFTLDSIPDNNTGLRIDIVTNDISDLNGNKATLNSTYIVRVTY